MLQLRSNQELEKSKLEAVLREEQEKKANLEDQQVGLLSKILDYCCKKNVFLYLLNLYFFYEWIPEIIFLGKKVIFYFFQQLNM